MNGLLIRTVVGVALALGAGGGSGVVISKRAQTATDVRLDRHDAELKRLDVVDAARFDYIQRYLALEEAFSRAERDIEALRRWQDDWVRNGALPIDGVQNTRIDELKRRLDRLLDLVQDLEAVHMRTADGGEE